jgi:hypothetical protein
VEYDAYEEAKEFRDGPVPIDRVGGPIELGDPVTYLCSNQAGNVN